jgi:hypothetical protein
MTIRPEQHARALAVLALLVLGIVVAAQAPDPANGNWQLNVAKSKFSPGPAPKSTTATISAAGAAYKVVVEAVAADGAKVHWEYSANFDGKPHPVKGNPDGDMVVAKRVNATTVETSYTLKGKPTTTNTRVVSADGKTMTVTSTGTNGQGQKINNVQVFDRG